MRRFQHRIPPFRTSIASVISGILLAGGIVQAIKAVSDPLFFGAQILFYHVAHWIHPYRFGLSHLRVQWDLFYSYGLSSIFCVSLAVVTGRFAKPKLPPRPSFK